MIFPYGPALAKAAKPIVDAMGEHHGDPAEPAVDFCASRRKDRQQVQVEARQIFAQPVGVVGRRALFARGRE